MRNTRTEALALYLRGADYTSADIAQLSGMDPAQARGAVRRLASTKVVARVGSEYPPRYRLVQADRMSTVEIALASRPALQAAWTMAPQEVAA